MKRTSGIHAVVITVSDACSRGEREDTSGKALVQLLTGIGADIVENTILSDDPEPLIKSLQAFADRDDVNLIITTGGTGLGPRDNTPEATQSVIEREAPGIAEAIRAEKKRIREEERAAAAEAKRLAREEAAAVRQAKKEEAEANLSQVQSEVKTANAGVCSIRKQSS